MYRVEAHNNSKEYFSSINMEEGALHVTSNTSLSYMIKEINYIKERDKWKVIDIESLIKSIYKEFNKVLNVLKLKATLRRIIIVLKSKGNNLKELKFLEDNLDILVIDFINIIEAGVKELKFFENNEIKDVLSEIYTYLSRCEIFKELTIEILNVEKARGFYKFLEGYNGEGINKIYFYNLNYLDVKRYSIIEMLKLAGFKIVFRIPYFSNLKSLNRCWENIYGDKELFEIIKNSAYSNAKRIPKYVAALEGLEYEPYDEKVECFTYSEISDFRRDFNNVEDKKRQRNFFTFKKDSLKACLDKFNLDENHGFQSKVGRFLLDFYSLEVDKKDVKLNFDLYRSLITSGWIEYRGINGVKFNSYLVDNATYFNGVKSINEVIERIYKLKDLEEINNIFEGDFREKIREDDKKRLLLNPFRAFGYNNPEKYNITISYLLECTLYLKRFAIKALYSEGGLINLKDHFNNLSLNFKNKYILSLYENSTDFEKNILSRIWAILESESLISKELSKYEIREYFNISLSNKNEIEEDIEFAIEQLEGFIFRKSKIGTRKGEKIIYISDLSFKAYEEYVKDKKMKEKILKFKDYEDIFKASLNGRHRDMILKGLELKKNSMKVRDSYIRFSIANFLINFEGIKSFSWISSLRNDDMESVLLKQIKAIYNLKEEVIKTSLDFNKCEEEIYDIKSYIYDKEELLKSFKKYSEVSYRDLDFCLLKFLYSSVIGSYPMYFSNFHNKLLFSSLVSILKNSIDESYKNIGKFIFPLFPQWNDVIKSNILICEYGRENVRDYKYFDGINYPKNIDLLYLLKSKYAVGENWKIKNRYKNGNFKAEEYYKEFVEGYLKEEMYNRGIHCTMCPYVYLCKKGEFSVEFK